MPITYQQDYTVTTQISNILNNLTILYIPHVLPDEKNTLFLNKHTEFQQLISEHATTDSRFSEGATVQAYLDNHGSWSDQNKEAFSLCLLALLDDNIYSGLSAAVHPSTLSKAPAAPELPPSEAGSSTSLVKTTEFNPCNKAERIYNAYCTILYFIKTQTDLSKTDGRYDLVMLLNKIHPHVHVIVDLETELSALAQDFIREELNELPTQEQFLLLSTMMRGDSADENPRQRLDEFYQRISAPLRSTLGKTLSTWGVDITESKVLTLINRFSEYNLSIIDSRVHPDSPILECLFKPSSSRDYDRREHLRIVLSKNCQSFNDLRKYGLSYWAQNTILSNKLKHNSNIPYSNKIKNVETLRETTKELIDKIFNTIAPRTFLEWKLPPIGTELNDAQMRELDSLLENATSAVQNYRNTLGQAILNNSQSYLEKLSLSEYEFQNLKWITEIYTVSDEGIKEWIRKNIHDNALDISPENLYPILFHGMITPTSQWSLVYAQSVKLISQKLLMPAQFPLIEQRTEPKLISTHTVILEYLLICSHIYTSADLSSEVKHDIFMRMTDETSSFHYYRSYPSLCTTLQNRAFSDLDKSNIILAIGNALPSLIKDLNLFVFYLRIPSLNDTHRITIINTMKEHLPSLRFRGPETPTIILIEILDILNIKDLNPEHIAIIHNMFDSYLKQCGKNMTLKNYIQLLSSEHLSLDSRTQLVADLKTHITTLCVNADNLIDILCSQGLTSEDRAQIIHILNDTMVGILRYSRFNIGDTIIVILTIKDLTEDHKTAILRSVSHKLSIAEFGCPTDKITVVLAHPILTQDLQTILITGLITAHQNTEYTQLLTLLEFRQLSEGHRAQILNINTHRINQVLSYSPEYLNTLLSRYSHTPEQRSDLLRRLNLNWAQLLNTHHKLVTILSVEYLTDAQRSEILEDIISTNNMWRNDNPYHLEKHRLFDVVSISTLTEEQRNRILSTANLSTVIQTYESLLEIMRIERLSSKNLHCILNEASNRLSEILNNTNKIIEIINMTKTDEESITIILNHLYPNFHIETLADFIRLLNLSKLTQVHRDRIISAVNVHPRGLPVLITGAVDLENLLKIQTLNEQNCASILQQFPHPLPDKMRIVKNVAVSILVVGITTTVSCLKFGLNPFLSLAIGIAILAAVFAIAYGIRSYSRGTLKVPVLFFDRIEKYRIRNNSIHADMQDDYSELFNPAQQKRN